jgi:hypothetical protein
MRIWLFLPHLSMLKSWLLLAAAAVHTMLAAAAVLVDSEY